MVTMTAPGRETLQPRSDELYRALAQWPLQASLELRAFLTTPRCARTWTRQILWEWDLTQLSETAELVVSELTTNAVRFSFELAWPVIRLMLVSGQERLAVLVRDFHPGVPEPRLAGKDDESGRGLQIAENVSDQFGWHRPRDGMPGKVVWAILKALSLLASRQDCSGTGRPAEITRESSSGLPVPANGLSPDFSSGLNADAGSVAGRVLGPDFSVRV